MSDKTAFELTQRVCAWFERNPEEALSVADIELKFDVPPHIDIEDTLQPAVLQRALFKKRMRTSAARPKAEAITYCLPDSDLATPRTPAGRGHFSTLTKAAADKATPRRTARNELPPIKPQDIKVSYDTPEPPRTSGRNGVSKYAVLFEALDKVGASTTLAMEYRDSLCKAIQAYAKTEAGKGKKFSVRTIDTNTAGIWRTA